MVRCTLVLIPFLLQSAGAQPPASVNCGSADLSGLRGRVYVSVAGTDSAGCGQSVASACKTIQQGIKNCKGDGCGVLVRYGTYGPLSPAIQLAEGVNVYGGCSFDGVDRRYRSTVMGLPAISANNIRKSTMLYGFVAMGADAGPGQASIAMTVSNSSELTLSHNLLTSGKGGDGAGGANANGSPGGTGYHAMVNTGGSGGRACPASPPSNDSGFGGQGADFQQVRTWGCFALCSCENNNYPHSLGKQGKSSGSVLGGSGAGRGRPGCNCGYFIGSSGNGDGGGPGNSGSCGATGGNSSNNNRGGFREITWVPSTGGRGDTGQVGSGGGGGGSGGYGVHIDDRFHVTDLPGRAGGGGGGGGCGGPGGQGGQQGGASVPLVLFNSSIVLIPNTNVLIPGPGGLGGNGAGGGFGGPGGPGADGRRGSQQDIGTPGFCNGNAPGNGGRGGDGGQGGAGSGGAGGNGGPSFAIALVNSPQFPTDRIAFYPAQPGAGGVRGVGGRNTSSQCKGADGQGGVPGFFDNQNPILSFTSTSTRESEAGERGLP